MPPSFYEGTQMMMNQGRKNFPLRCSDFIQLLEKTKLCSGHSFFIFTESRRFFLWEGFLPRVGRIHKLDSLFLPVNSRNVWFTLMLFLCTSLLDYTQPKLRRWSERKRRLQAKRINYFSLADKSFSDLCSTFSLLFSSLSNIWGRKMRYFKVFQNIYLV